jgi:hypothetical protein
MSHREARTRGAAFTVFVNLAEERGRHVLKDPRHLRCLVAFATRHPRRQARLQAFRCIYQVSSSYDKPQSAVPIHQDVANAGLNIMEGDPKFDAWFEASGCCSEADMIIRGQRSFINLL